MTDRLLRRGEVERLTGLSRSSIYAAMARDEFPKPFRLLGRRAVAWKYSSIQRWIAERTVA